MDPHTIELPSKILIGRGVTDQIPELCRELGAKKILVLCDQNTRGIAGERIAESLKGFDAALEDVREHSLNEAERLKALTPPQNAPNCIIAAGGGGVIDVGKKIAIDLNSILISAPTAPSHDGMASERISLTKEGVKHSLRGKPPNAIVADIEILMNAPERLRASGGADVISNYTAVFDWKLGKDRGEYYSEYAGNLAMLSAQTVMDSVEMIRAGEERGIRNLVEALVSSGISMSLVGSSRPASGSEHLFSHALDALELKAEASSCSSASDGSRRSRGLHGEQCGLGTILMACHQGQDWKMVREKLKTLGAPTTAAEISLDQERVIQALLDAKAIRKRHTILEEKPLTRDTSLELCKKTGVL